MSKGIKAPCGMEDMFTETLPTGAQLRDAGMQQAVDHANAVEPNWSDHALAFVRKYVGYTKEPFQTEDLRLASLNAQVPEPPSKRAWGSVIMKAVKLNLIKRVGYAPVKNPLAHKTPAAVWVRM